MSDEQGESRLSSIARLCVGLSIIILIVMVKMQGCSIRDLQLRVGQLESERR